MRKYLGFWMMAAALGSAAGCGGSSTKCGDGTTNMKGTCVPDNQCGPGTKADPTSGQCVPDGSVVCTDGTVFDMATGTCAVDPNSCQDGTVLINNQCVDPTKGLTVDIEEGPEPNALGLLPRPDGNGGYEPSQNPAGMIALKAVGGPGFIIHGTIAPFQDVDGDGQMDPDVDTYLLTVNAPALLHITADGVHGIDAGFVAVAAVGQNDPAATWVRFGINITGDTSKRQLYLPEAGTYAIAVADTRTLFQYSTGGPISAAPGPGDYYITIDNLAIPTPTTITPASGVATQTGTVAADADVQFFTTTMGSGFNDVLLQSSTSQFVPGVVISDNGNLRAVADQGQGLFGPVPAEALVGGIQATDQPLIAVDNVYSTAIDPGANYTLTVTTNDSTPLSATGQTASQTEIVNSYDPNTTPITDLNSFYYDVTSADDVIGLKLSWNHPVDGVLVDQNLNIFSYFTFDPNNGFVGNTFSSYTGLLRHPAPGRYYFLVYDPNAADAGGNLIATSTYAKLTPTPITEGTPTAAQQVGIYGSNPFTYDKGADPWQTFEQTTSNAGTVTLSFYDPTAAYGRLDALRITPAGGAATTVPGDVAPLFAPALTNNAPKGRVVLADAPNTYFIKGNASVATSTNSYTLTFAKKNYVDFGTINTGDAAVTKANNTLAAGGTVDFFVLTDSAANLMQFVGTPTGTIKPDIVLNQLNADESVAVKVNASTTSAETMTVPAEAQKWVAVSVTGSNAATNGTFDMSAVVTPEATYTQSTPTATFTTICNLATTVTMHDDGSGFGATDEGLSNALAVPAGFQFFGATVTQIQVSTNGWASFQTNQASAAFANEDMPNADAPNAIIAPYWTDLANVQVCTLTTGSTMTIEWRGTTADPNNPINVAVQAQLNASNNTITFLYDTAGNMDDDGSDATVGIEDFAGAAASKVDYMMAGSIAAGNVFRFTP